MNDEEQILKIYSNKDLSVDELVEFGKKLGVIVG